MSFENYMNFDQFLYPKNGKSKNGKNGNGRKGSRHANHQSGEFDFGDLGLGFNGSFKNLGGDYLQKVNPKSGSYDYVDRGFDVGGSSGFDVGGQQSAISPLFQQGFGYSGKRTRLEKIADRETREEDRSRRKRLKREAKESKKSKDDGGGEFTPSGSQRLAGVKGDTIGGKILSKLSKKRSHSKYSKEDLKAEDEADKQTRARLRELIEEEKQRKAEKRK